MDLLPDEIIEHIGSFIDNLNDYISFTNLNKKFRNALNRQYEKILTLITTPINCAIITQKNNDNDGGMSLIGITFFVNYEYDDFINSSNDIISNNDRYNKENTCSTIQYQTLYLYPNNISRMENILSSIKKLSNANNVISYDYIDVNDEFYKYLSNQSILLYCSYLILKINHMKIIWHGSTLNINQKHKPFFENLDNPFILVFEKKNQIQNLNTLGEMYVNNGFIH